jgi:protein TonB
MFEQSLVESGGKARTKKPMTILLSFALQALVLAIMVIIPLIYYQVLPSTALSSILLAPPPPPPPPPPPKALPKVVVHKIVSEIKNNELIAPRKIPKKIAIIKESAPPPPTAGVVGGVGDGGGAGGVLGGVLGGIPSAAPPPPPPPKAAPPSIIHVGGQVQSANCLRCPPPQYPPLARQARIQGVVRLHAIIAKDGTIQDLQVISGHPMLVGAAMQAVRQWRYAPTLLNGTPVEVDTEITVNFTLAG